MLSESFIEGALSLFGFCFCQGAGRMGKALRGGSGNGSVRFVVNDE
ncbi:MULTISPECIES: hypothetical protein [unclassified Bartonella]